MDDNRLLKRVGFFGDSATPPEDSEYKRAYACARDLAERGYVVVNGGGPGIMNAATQGAESVGGETVAVTFTPVEATGFEGKYVGNVTDKVIKTHNYIERMFGLMAEADVFLIFNGGTGTVSEFGTAWVLAKLYKGHHKPFILVGEFWRPIVKAFEENMNIDEGEMSVFEIVDTIEEVPGVIEKLDRALQEVDHSHCKTCSEAAFMT